MSVNITSFAGTPLRDADLAAGKYLTESGAARAEYSWDRGVAVGRYLASLRAGQLVGCRCGQCGRVLFPPRAFCEECFHPTSQWVTLSDTGIVQTFAICHIAWDASRVSVPTIPAVIAIDGASPGMGLLHLIGGVAPDAVAVGHRVRARWRPADQRRGGDHRHRILRASGGVIVGLIDRISTSDRLESVQGTFPIDHVYTVGTAGERVLRELKDNGQLLGTRCDACEVTYAPARLYCERCLHELDEWVDVPLAGRLLSFTRLHRDVDGNPLARPAILGLIELAGATGAFVHWVGGTSAESLSVGQPVQAELRPAGSRRGSITDILYFRPSS